MMHVLAKIGAVSGLIILLILIRVFAHNMFYDPFIEYFKNDFLFESFPAVTYGKLALHLFYRFSLNSIISLLIVYCLYQNKEQLMLALKVFGVALFIMLPVFLWQVLGEFSNGYLLAFYVRRMLIHPIILLVLIPAFYYQNKLK